ncbi:MAG: response regulator transcription factor [Labedaea sp.]
MGRPIQSPQLVLAVLPLIANGMSNAEIAAQMYLSIDTVKSRVSGLIALLGARDRAHAVTLAFEQGHLRRKGDTHRPLRQRRELADRHASTCALLRPPECDCHELEQAAL